MYRLSPHRLCVGVDPHIREVSRLVHWSGLERRVPKNSSQAYFMQWFGEHLLRAASQSQVGVVKFQLACFEVLGSAGWVVLEQLVAQAKSAGMYVILDGKRGDIFSTMSAYGAMVYEHMQADSATLNPYMGQDVWLAWQPWLQSAQSTQSAEVRSVYVVWRTSNPSAHELQNYGTPPLAEHLLDRLLDSFAQHQMLESLGLVIGAQQLAKLSQPAAQRLVDIPLLIPGVGAQGAVIDQGELAIKPWQLWSVSRGLYALEQAPSVAFQSQQTSSTELGYPRGQLDDVVGFFVQRIQWYKQQLG